MTFWPFGIRHDDTARQKVVVIQPEIDGGILGGTLLLLVKSLTFGGIFRAFWVIESQVVGDHRIG
jgi:hypothetical protein